MDRSRISARSATAIGAGIAMVCIVQAEFAAALLSVVVGMVYHAVLLAGLLEGSLVAPTPEQRRTFVILALVPLLRILSLIVPLPWVPQAWWYGMAAVPLLLAAYRAARLAGIAWPELRFGAGGLLQEFVLVLGAITLGFIAYAVLRPPRLVADHSGLHILAGAALLLAFAAFVEEFIFRHLLQQVVQECFGRLGIIASSLLYASMYVGSLSPRYIAFAGAVGLLFALWTRFKGSFWGVVAAHAVINISLLLVWPALWP